jgi:hypothetical protein
VSGIRYAAQMLHILPQPLSLARLAGFNVGSTPDVAFLSLALADSQTVTLVDDPAAPRVVLLTGSATGVGFLWGDVARCGEVASALSQIRSYQRSQWCCLSASSAWVAALSAHGAQTFACLHRVCYRFDRQAFEELNVRMPPLRSEYVLEPLQESLVPQIKTDLESDFDLRRWKTLPTPGFLACAGERCTSLAWGPMAGGMVELGVVTAPQHQKLGLAKRVAAHLICELLAKQCVPHVSTNAANEPAKHWANSLGFVDPHNHEWLVVKQQSGIAA